MKKPIYVLLALSFCLAPMNSYAWAAEPKTEGTRVMNAHGEEMELDFKLYDPGTELIVDYAKYGTFQGIGTDKYVYKITDRKGLAAAVGEGIDPNNSIYKDPVYRMLVPKGKLAGSQWDYVNIENQQLAFYKWAAAHDTPAVQQFYLAVSLEKLGEYNHAIKAYYNLIIQYPRQVGWTFWHTPLYMSKLAMDRIDFITRKHPELGLQLQGAEIRIENGYNASVQDDIFYVNPGKIAKVDPETLKPKRENVSELNVIKTIGTGSTQLVQYENHHWQLLVDGKPFMVKGIAYAPSPVGRSPNENGYDPNNGWFSSDVNKNGIIDGPFEAFVDKNKNNVQDPDEQAVGDFQIMKEMGVNTIRMYHHAADKEILRKLYKDYGIRVVMGDLLGMYAAGSGAEWYKGTDYTNPEHLENMRKSVRQMVEEFKDEPYVLMWMLGNESNYGEVGDPDPKSYKAGMGSNAKAQPDAHYKFVNEVAGMIKSIDPTRPVGYSNGEVITIDILSKNCDNIDVFGANVYRGASGFGKSFWEDAKRHLDKPVLFTEYGCPAYVLGKSQDFAEAKQKEYHQGNWEDILYNSAGSGAGNAIGGFIFEYVDEWWKSGLPPKFSSKEHETIGDFVAAFPDGYMHEEWLGVASQGDGSQSPFLRQTRQVYDYYKKVWNES